MTLKPALGWRLHTLVSVGRAPRLGELQQISDPFIRLSEVPGLQVVKDCNGGQGLHRLYRTHRWTRVSASTVTRR